MSANTAVFKIWKASNLVTMILWKSCKTFQTRRTVCISARDRFHFNNVNRAETVSQKRDWNKIMSEAAKIVGYPTSSLSIRELLRDEIANAALHLEKLVGSNYPVLKISKVIICNGRNTQVFGLILLLISKAAGHLNAKPIEEDKAAGVLHSQRTLAEIMEMIRIGNLIHRGLVNINIDTGSMDSTELNNIILDNKITLLYGDYLFSASYSKAAALKNQNLSLLISTAVRDLCQAEFVARRDNQNFPIPSIPPEDRTGYALKEWTLLNTYAAGSLLGKGCQSTLKIAGHSKEIEEKGYEFGKHLALAWQASLDLGLCINKDKGILQNLCAAPIMFHVEHDPSLLIELDKGLDSVENVDYLKVLNIVAAGPGIGLTKELVKKHSQKAMEILSVFKESDARKALSNIIVAIGDF
ncbi:PREDICTED: decaprenyl-diphosphate synthase subunit 2-like [Trachymyrmex cornetzi]|uniref:Decaprenyl-diphosphate synthase subunit 2 n=1 Tax=Trachymyrmex cornetzi TaxID=471704 RepID=A0A151J9I1_9HYME|nr:PREDICTED: decaprenyl-diphosphate synthase subunit 2-like [Trachymyrmex cornetzi]KYN21677.1 Decaprenyl-diphosphate synthase subunit 2 [Trachymyrmex cornetzi]